MGSNRHQEYLEALPVDWEKGPIESLGAIYSGGTPSREQPSFWNGFIAWVTPGELTNLNSKYLHKTREYITEAGLASSSARLLPPNSILVTTRATIGLVVITTIRVCTNQGFKNIVPNGLTNADFYYHLLKSVAPEMSRLASGSTFDEISRRDFSSIVLPRPKVLEQGQIASILDTIADLIALTDTHIAKLKKVKAGLFHDLLTRGINEHGELRDLIQHPEQFKDSPLGKVPKEWEVISLGAVIGRSGGFIQTGPFGSQLHAYEYVDSGVPVIMPQDILNGRISTEQIEYITPDKAQSLKRHIVQLNDVVFARRGELNRCAAIGRREENWFCGTGSMLARMPKHEIDGFWLAAIYQHYVSQRQILARAVGSTMVNLNSTLLNSLIIAKPDIAEQKAIMERAAIQDRRLQAKESLREKLKLLKKGLMSDLLTGRVRVKVDS